MNISVLHYLNESQLLGPSIRSVSPLRYLLLSWLELMKNSCNKSWHVSSSACFMHNQRILMSLLIVHGALKIGHCVSMSATYDFMFGEILLSVVWVLINIWIITGFGFVSFESDDPVERLVAEHFVNINGKQVRKQSFCFCAYSFI